MPDSNAFIQQSINQMDTEIIKTVSRLSTIFITVELKTLHTEASNEDFTAILNYVSRLSDLYKQRKCLLAKLAILEAREI